MKFYDNTELSTHRDCARKYYFRHVADLERIPEEGSPATAPELAFGLAWHAAMDTTWLMLCGTGKSAPSVQIVSQAAYLTWEKTWEEWGFPSYNNMDAEQRADWAPRTPDTAIEMLVNYIQEREEMLRYQTKLVSIEQPFAVPLFPDDKERWYCGRLDKVIEYQGGIEIIDHKTTTLYKKEGYFRSDFLESFSPNSQVDGYAYAGQMLYGERFKGVMIDAALVHRTVHDGFKLLPVRRAFEQLDSWLWEARHRVHLVEQDAADLAGVYPSAPFMPAYEKNTGNCTKYFRNCPYMDPCKGVPNPVGEMASHGILDGYKVSKWSPFDVNKLEKLFPSKEVAHE